MLLSSAPRACDQLTPEQDGEERALTHLRTGELLLKAEWPAERMVAVAHEALAVKHSRPRVA
jgi:hypothetical protein